LIKGRGRPLKTFYNIFFHFKRGLPPLFLNMQLIKSPSHLILTPKEELENQLLRMEKAGRTCYQSEKGEVTKETAEKFIARLIKLGHESVIEHSQMTVKFFDCSRGFTHEMVRHRLASFSQESTRYVDYAKDAKGEAEVNLNKFQIKFVAPPHTNNEEPILLEDGRKFSFAEMLTECEKFYRALRIAGWLPEDARQILPTAVKADIVVSANFREWRHIFKMRLTLAAHWEIRGILGNLLDEVQQVLPAVFGDFAEAGQDKNGLRYFKQVKAE